MIKFITWYQYLFSIGGATLLYYIIIGWLYYKTEIITAFGPKTRKHHQIVAAAPVPQGLRLMGEPEFDGHANVAPEDLIFAAPDEAEPEPAETTAAPTITPHIPPQPDETFLLGPVADFLKELKSGFSLLKEAQGDKEEFLGLLGILSEKYSAVMQSSYRPLLDVFILEMSAEQLPFALTLTDLQSQA